MTGERADRESVLDGIGLGERARLVRYCARFTGDPDAAEDLAQQTLIEAWRNGHKLYGPEVREGWLFGIARNICLSWAHRRRRELSRLVALDGEREDASDLHDRLAGEADLEVDLERDDLARLLDRAMGLLPEATRAVLVERYIEESPQAEVAARLGLSEGAVEARLHRGKIALHKVLTTEFRDEAAAYGLIDPDDGGWQETRIWCLFCGEHRLMGRFTEGHTELTFRCPGCSREAWSNISHLRSTELFSSVKGFKPALNRQMKAMGEYFATTLASGSTPGPCGHPLRPSEGLGVPIASFLRGEPGVHLRCPVCGLYSCNMTLAQFALSLPEGLRFWREHPRLRSLPVHEIESAGRLALVRSFEGATDGARLDIVVSRETWEPIEIRRASGG